MARPRTVAAVAGSNVWPHTQLGGSSPALKILLPCFSLAKSTVISTSQLGQRSATRCSSAGEIRRSLTFVMGIPLIVQSTSAETFTPRIFARRSTVLNGGS